MNVDTKTWFEFFDITCELNAITCIRVEDDELREDLNRTIRRLEEWRVKHLELDTADTL